VPEPFEPFARHLTRGYVVLAVALIALVVATTSVLALLLYVGTLDDAVAADAQRATARAAMYEGVHRPLNGYAPALVEEVGGRRVRVLVYDNAHRLLAESARRTAIGRPFTRALAAFLGLHPATVAVAGGTIVIAPDFEGFARLLGRYFATVLPIGAVAVLVAWLVGRRITRRAIAPLQDVAAALRRIAAGDFAPAPIPAGDVDLRDLTAAYNDVAHRLTTATAQRERNESQMRQFVADAGHELRSPLTIVMGYLEVLQRGVVADAEGVARVHATMLAESRRMRASIDKLIFLARLERPATPRTERIDTATIVRRAVEALAPLAGSNRIRVHGTSSPTVVDAEEGELYEAVKNVIENAVRYAPESPIEVRLAQHDRRVRIVVSDRGPGMEPQDVEHAFDRFYRGSARATAEGSGLGLAIAKRAVERIGGSIRIESRPADGTRVMIDLPAG
jgi:two-component system OmpR family sensor kinase